MAQETVEEATKEHIIKKYQKVNLGFPARSCSIFEYIKKK